MADRLAQSGHFPESFLVQRMAPSGVEMIVGITQDPQFGPVVVCGAGGVTAEVLRDVSARLSPLTARDAAEMVRGLRTYPLLTGFRGAPPADVAALEDVVLRLGALAEDLPQVAELDCNPVFVLEHGAAIVDARVRVAPTDPPRPLGARR
jgi:acyl-CoA synthetase (NDP forming)